MVAFKRSLIRVVDEKGTLFSCQPSSGNPAIVLYRPHETWTARADWRIELPEGEEITGNISLHIELKLR